MLLISMTQVKGVHEMQYQHLRRLGQIIMSGWLSDKSTANNGFQYCPQSLVLNEGTRSIDVHRGI